MSHFFARPEVSKGIPKAEQLTTLWTLRALVPLGGHMQFVSRHGVASDPLARQIGFDEWIDGESEDFNLAAARKQLRQRHDEAERDHFAATPPKRLRENVVRLAKLINLTPAECRIVEFSVLLQCEQILEEALETLGSMFRTKMISSMATLLNLPNGEVHVALASNGVLARSGIVTLDSAFASSLKVSLSLLSQQFANVMLDEDAEPTQLLRDVVSMSPPSELQSASFPHVEDSLAVLRPLLRKSLNHEREGVNILIYGPPGTGKTELTRVLALELETDLFEISSQNQEGDPLKPEERLRAYRAAQTLLKKRRALLIFDEIEDVFEGNDFPTSVKHGKTSRKAWINRTLEVNIIPTFWLSNDIGSMDRAFLRRFDLIIELPIPPQSQREKIIAKHCGGFLSPDQQASLARVDHLAPALISRAASIISLVRTEFSEVRVAPTFRMILNGTLQAQGHTRIRENDPSALPDYYDPQFINSDCDLKEVANGLIRSKAGRVCLYGPPGTGKSAWCRWLANQLGIPIHAKKASDLVSMWLGETEKKIASAFREAESEGALLIIDEVDSFLQDRRGAHRSWEISQVNEMLTQIESFPGVFVASTNLMDSLDQAALRRFDLKARLDYLKPCQAQKLFQQFCAVSGFSQPSESALTGVRSIRNLTPGDFASVQRQSRFRPITDQESLITALRSECAIKEAAVYSMGFLS